MKTNCSTDISNLLNILRLTGKKYDTDKITRAYEYAKDLHDGQFRVSGEPYISHPIAVAEIVAGLELDTDSICAALLHDTVEDCADRTDLKVIEKKFGADVAVLVDGLTKMIQLNIEDKEEAHIENLRKMLLAMSKDVRVIFIKLCDRLHNMRTLAVKRDDKRRKTALETMQVYAPLAHRLGMQKIKHELENIGLSYLDPFGYGEITQHIENKYGENAEFIGKIRKSVEEKLTENNIHFTLEGRIKSVYSIYRKMYTQNKSFDEIYDFYAMRIIVDTELECYTALGIIHEMFKSIPGRFKDYISTPKSNLYQSLHTTVIGREGIPFEVQIRTWDMHHVAEYGIAAHWKYKSGEKSKEEMDKKLEWIARLIETEDDTKDPDEFIHAIKTDMFQDETFIFTPKGDVIALPHGSTVIDFAYAIHSGVGNSMTGAKINGMIVPIDRVPQNGEIVEILTSSSSKGPSRDWLKIVKTSEARTKIRAWFKKEKRSENIIAGKAIVEAEIKKIGKNHTEAQRNEIIANIAQRVGFASSDDLYNTLGYGGLSISKISMKIVEEFDRVVKVSEPIVQKSEVEQIKEQIKNVQPKNTKSTNSVIVDGEKGCLVKFAHCCNPLPGDDIIGFVTKGYGVSIHKCDCPNVNNSLKDENNRSRWLNAHWEITSHTSADMYEAHLRIFVQDRMGILADISVALADMKVYILQINTTSDADGNSIVNLKVSCKNVEHYHSIVSRLKSVSGVVDVVRGFS